MSRQEPGVYSLAVEPSTARSVGRVVIVKEALPGYTRADSAARIQAKLRPSLEIGHRLEEPGWRPGHLI